MAFDIERWLLSIFSDAITHNASDIHIVPEDKHIHIKFRVNGKFMKYRTIEIGVLETLVGKLKIMSNLRMEESRLPQDGSFSVNLDGKEIYVRTSTMPSLYGEKIVLRILNPENESISLEKIGLNPPQIRKIKEYVKRKNGLILIVWPTGSGKSTTILSIMKEFNPEEFSISTLEDPIEYRIKWITHSQINHWIGFDFSVGLRSVLRQDPDIIMVGEIRDVETAKFSMEAGITGHLVLSTLHANSWANTVQRLVSLGIESNMIISGLKLIICQQLIRKLCPHCKRKYAPNADIREKIESVLKEKIPPGKEIFLYDENDLGCTDCNYTWFKWRTGIFEVFELTKEMKKSILSKQSENALEDQAEKDGIVSLQQGGIMKVLEWVISLRELESSMGYI